MGRNIFLIIICCLGLFAFFEGMSRLVLSVSPLFDRIAGDNDTSWRIRWIKRHRSQIEIFYEFDAYDSTKGWVLKANLINKTVFYGKTLNSNSKGLRGSVEYSYDKPSNKMRILILGDSFTFGDWVSDTETYPYYLQQMLPNTEVLNFGIHGYAHDQMLLYFQEEGVKYNPDIVILGFVYDDMSRNMLEFRDYSKPKFELVANELKMQNVPVLPPELIFKKEFYRSKFFDLFTILYQKYMWKYGKNKERMEIISTAILDELIATIESIGAVPVFVYLPTPMEIKNLDREEGILPDCREDEYFLRYCKGRTGIQYLSLLPYFVANKKNGVKFTTWGHWDSKGNKMIAQGIKEYLLYNNLTIE